MMVELWKVVDGFDGIYSVSNFGRVKSKERTQLYEDGRIFHYPEKVLKQSTPKTGKRAGYMSAHFYCNGKRETMCVHRLVATYFVDKPEGKDVVNHKDGNKSNNHYSNLEWVTYAENNAHAIETGLKQQTPSSYRSKLTKLDKEARQDIIANCKFRVPGFMAKDFAKKYGVASPTIVKALRQGLDE